MTIPDDQLAELRRAHPEAQLAGEGGTTFVLLPQLELPPGLTPARVDALLCPVPRDGYSSRLYFASPISGGPPRNWHVKGLRILDRPWYAASWQTAPGLRLIQMVDVHLDLFRSP